MNYKHIQLPINEEDALSLKAGDAVLLSGTIYTARDAAHKRLTEMMQQNKELPIDLDHISIYYVGPTANAENQVIGSAGPTTSSRMDAYTPTLLDAGMKVMIGKGRRSEAVKESIIRNKAVYFIACGGAGALLSHSIIKSEVIAFDDLLSEAIRKLEVKDFPCFVGIDANGNDIYEIVKKGI